MVELTIWPCLSTFPERDSKSIVFSFHPSLPLLATTSGQRQFEEPGNGSDNEDTMDQDLAIHVDNSLRIWVAGEKLLQ